jgi:uncharacterized membrane protein
MADLVTVVGLSLAFGIFNTILIIVTNLCVGCGTFDKASSICDYLRKEEVVRTKRRERKDRERDERRRAQEERRKEKEEATILRRERKTLARFGDLAACKQGAPLRDGMEWACTQPVEFHWNKSGAVYPKFAHPRRPNEWIALNKVQLVPTLADEKDELGKLCIHRLPYPRVTLRPASTKKDRAQRGPEVHADGLTVLHLNEEGYIVWD